MQKQRSGWKLIPAVIALHAMPVLATNGHVLHGVGAINQSMGGAGIATSIDVIGANYNNVSSISFLTGSALELSVELFAPDRSHTGVISGGPAGTVDSEIRAALLPAFGAVYSDYRVLQMTPSAAYQVTPDLSLGVGVNIDWASLVTDPWPAAVPNASGFPTGTRDASAWGWGFTLGATYKLFDHLMLGLVFKSPQWFGNFSWNS